MGKLALAKPRFELKKDEVSREQMRGFIIAMVVITMMMMACILNVSFADSDYASTIRDLIEKMVSIIGTIFQAVGAVLTVYSVGQLILAFKNEDADSKSRASTMMVVGVVLIALPGVIETLGLVDMITGSI
ncbi:hypothetical protein IMM1_05280 [Pseudocoprococcus immobilis]